MVYLKNSLTQPFFELEKFFIIIYISALPPSTNDRVSVGGSNYINYTICVNSSSVGNRVKILVQILVFWVPGWSCLNSWCILRLKKFWYLQLYWWDLWNIQTGFLFLSCTDRLVVGLVVYVEMQENNAGSCQINKEDWGMWDMASHQSFH